MIARITDAGHIFVSPDYRLIPSGPTTGHAIVEDIKDVFRFLTHYSSEEQLLDPESVSSNPSSRQVRVEIDPNRIAVAGSSSGGLCAYLSAMHATPQPKAILSLYGMGGSFLIPHYYLPKRSVFFQGREILDPVLFEDFLYPRCRSSRTITDSPNTYFPPDAPTDVAGKPGSLANLGPPGFPSNRRMFLGRLYLQLGEYLDYYTGQHEPSLSAALRKEAENLSKQSVSLKDPAPELAHIIPPQHQHLFPSLLPAHMYASWPPTYFLHGSIDSAVPVHESQHLHGLLCKAGVACVMSVVDGMEHSFDYQPTAEVVHREEFDRIGKWLDGFLRE